MFWCGAALIAACVILPPSQPFIPVPAGSDCAYQLMDMGYRGIAGDGIEQVWAPESVVNNVCN